MKLSKVQQRLVDKMRKENLRITYWMASYWMISEDSKKQMPPRGVTMATIRSLENRGVLVKRNYLYALTEGYK